MISDEDDFYMKIVALDEIYNFLVFSFFIKIFKKIKQKFQRYINWG